MRTVFAILFMAFLVTACGGGGADIESKQNIKTTTTGQELIDLKQALDSGAISKEEYEEQREIILERGS